jgi:hypothetical protein
VERVRARQGRRRVLRVGGLDHFFTISLPELGLRVVNPIANPARAVQ